MRRFFIEQKINDTQNLEITGQPAHHIRNVLRFKKNDTIILFDGTGFDYKAKINNISNTSIQTTIFEKYFSKTEPPIKITLAQAMLKEKKMDTLIRQATELGISQWIPFICERTIPKPNKNKMSSKIKRWQKISSEAAKQCKRSQLLEINNLITFSQLMALNKSDLKILFWEKSSHLLDEQKNKPENILLVLGPEGGFSPEEVEMAKINSFIITSLGPRILKAETATISACTLVQYIFGDMGKNFLDKL